MRRRWPKDGVQRLKHWKLPEAWAWSVWLDKIGDRGKVAILEVILLVSL